MKELSKRSWFINAMILIQSISLSWILLASIGQYFPNIGMDYKYFIPRLIDSFIHYNVNGFSIQWYTPSFGGGLPSYPNPQQIQFSIPQLFTQFTDPYTAILLSVFVFVLIGHIASYYFFHKVLGVGVYPSLLSGSLFLANGFYFQHLGVGHLTFITLPLFPVLLIGLFRKHESWLNGFLIGVTLAALLHHGSFYLTVYFGLSALLILGLIAVFRPDHWNARQTIKNLLTGAIVTIALGGSKLSAVLHFLRFFPRQITDEYHATTLQALKSIFLQLFGAMGLRPFGILTGAKAKGIWDLLMTNTGSQLAFWELDISITPVIWLLILFGALLLIWRIIQKKVGPRRGQWVSLLFLVVCIEIVIEFIISKGFVYPILSQLPILSSLHVNPRYTLVLFYPLVFLATLALEQGFQFVERPKYAFGLFIGILLLALIPLMVYFEMPMDNLGRRQFYVEGSQEVYWQAKNGETFPIQAVKDDLNDARVFDTHASNLNPYEVIFGYELGKFQHQLVEGSPMMVSDGKFNFNDPSGMVFPELNNNYPLDRFPADQPEQLSAFLNRRQPDRARPLYQTVLDIISLVTFSLSVILLIWRSLYRRKCKEAL